MNRKILIYTITIASLFDQRLKSITTSPLPLSTKVRSKGHRYKKGIVISIKDKFKFLQMSLKIK